MKSERFSSHTIGCIGAGTGSIPVRHLSSDGATTDEELKDFQDMLYAFPVTPREKQFCKKRKPAGS